MILIPLLIICGLVNCRGLCPKADRPGKVTKFVASPGYPSPARRGGQCKFLLSVNYGEFVKLEKIDNGIRCSGSMGIVAVEMVNIQGSFKSGDISPASRFESKSFCRGSPMPPFASSDVQIEIVVNYSLGDKWRIGFKSMATRKGPAIPRTKAKLTTRAPQLAPVTQMAPWTPPNQNNYQVHSPHGHHVNQVDYFAAKQRPPSNYGQQAYGFNNYPDYGQPMIGSNGGAPQMGHKGAPPQMGTAHYGVHHQLPPNDEKLSTTTKPAKGASKLIMMFGAFGIVVIVVGVIGGGLWYKQHQMAPANPNHIPMK